MDKILLLNQGNTENIGDNAINMVLSTYLKNKNYDVDSELFWSEDKVFGKKYSKYPKIIRWLLWHCTLLMDLLNYLYINNLLKKKKYNLIIIGGGELLGCNYGFNSSLYIWTKIASKFSIPIIVYGVSGSLDMPSKKLNRNKLALSRCKYIFVRDSYTKKIINEHYKLKCERVHDCVFSYRMLFDKEFKKKDNNTILVTPILFYDGIKSGLNLKDEKEYILYMKKIILEYKENSEKILISCTDLSDENFAQKLYNDISKDSEFKNITVKFIPYTNLSNFIKLIKKTNIVISGRMHAMIIGKIYGTEIHPIIFKNKLKVFNKEYKSIKDIKKIESESYEQLKKTYECISK